MSANDPIRLNDISGAKAVAIPAARREAERQFKLSFALIVALTLGTLTAMATVPAGPLSSGYDLSSAGGYGVSTPMASRN